MTTACRAAFLMGTMMAGAAALAGPPAWVIQTALRQSFESNPANMGIELLRTREAGGLGLPRVIHFRVGHAAGFDRVVPVVIDDPRVARVVDDARVLAQQTVGYAVVEMVGTGSTRARIGDHETELVCVAPTDDAGSRLRITSPAEGAAVWGTIGVGATWWRPAASEGARPVLRVGVGEHERTIEAKWSNTIENGPMGLAYFEMDADGLAEGDARVRICLQGLSGREVVETIGVRVVKASPDAALAGECEAEYDLPPLPEDRRERKPTIGEDKNASGGKFWSNAGSNPRFRFPVDVPDGRPGWYQVVLAAAGDPACSALPSVGITIDEGNRPRNASAIAGPSWHRAPIGTPVLIEPGRHILRMDFLNDFGTRGSDRNLRLDRIEVLRVADGGGAAGQASNAPVAGAGEMMAGAEMMMAGGSSPGEARAAWPASVASRMTTGLRVAFEQRMDGREVAGDLDVRAAAWWPGSREVKQAGNVPRITLLLNGEAVASQMSVATRFVIPWGSLRAGENTLQMIGRMAGGDEVRTPVQRVLRPGVAGGDGSSAASSAAPQRFTVHEPGWSRASSNRVTDKQRAPERVCMAMCSEENQALELTLPENLEGEFRLEVESRGQNFKGAPVIEASLNTEGRTTSVGEVAPPAAWDSPALRVKRDSKDAALVTLPRGPKSLRLSLANPLREPAGENGKGGGERAAYVQAVTFKRTRLAADTAPVVSVLYPATGAQVRAGGVDAVVVRVSGPNTPASAEVLIDGAESGLRFDLRGQMGPYLVPVSLRGVSAGERRIEVRVTDAANRATSSEARVVRAVNTGIADATGMTEYERAIVLLDRFAFGPDHRELASVLTMGREEYLRDRLSAPASDAGVVTAMELAEIRYPDSRSGGDVPRRAIMEAMATPNPVRARFVLWAENHFSTWMRKTEPRRKADEHARFSRLGVAPFGELLMASATSPAMLVYLDQAQSFARRLNENYAREIMELHTLGVHGGYTQEDVTTLARLLTGWTLAREAVGAESDEAGFDTSPDDYGTADSYRFDPVLGDDASRRFFGREFGACGPEKRYQRTLTAIEMLAGHPNTAAFIARKIAEHYAGFPAPDALAADLASTFSRTDGDMRQVLLAAARHPQFWSTPAGTRTSHPPEFALRLSRCARSADANLVHEYLNLSGHGMFDRSTPDGYQENDDEVMDSNAMLQRWKLAKRLERPLSELLPAEFRSGDKPLTDVEQQQMVDVLAMRLTGRLLGEKSNAAAMELLGKMTGKREERARMLAVFVASCPEVQVK
ncbi:MAG: DUF1800 family protein [Phycisphaerales bacterium]|nr:DUF1800 family protein [Phycisphaerales bacterium]